ncbi:MAG: hypothetical protein XXXJIFNMEKO3_01629 [Candidatus Erwinia impunctatus]|nr:hypothetical protein XXXJIFNMEKO_01629 [Culicoides impunctatus]
MVFKAVASMTSIRILPPDKDAELRAKGHTRFLSQV